MSFLLIGSKKHEPIFFSDSHRSCLLTCDCCSFFSFLSKTFIKLLLYPIGLILVSGLFFSVEAVADSKIIDKTVVKALQVKPNLENGKKLFYNCALCHTPEGWGSPGGNYPQIAGQYQTVILKQMADIHKKNRDNPTMYPFSESIFSKGPQALADISAYIEKLPMVPNNSVGSGLMLEKGADLYDKNCKKCHLKNGEGDAKEFYPRIHGQHYQYIYRQLLWIKQGKRRNADAKMVKQIKDFTLGDLSLLADYVSRLQPEKKLLADHLDWRNPDFRATFMSVPKARKLMNE